MIALATTDRTVLGREVIAGEAPPPGFAPLTVDSTDQELDERVKNFGT